MGKMTPSTTFGLPSDPSVTGIDEPCTSASRISTECPARSSAAARLTATVLLPTPPLPLTTAIIRVLDSSRKAGASSEGPPCREVSRFWRSSSVITPKSTSTSSTLYIDTPDHVQRDEVAADLRVPYISQSLTDANLRQTIRRLMDLSSIS